MHTLETQKEKSEQNFVFIRFGIYIIEYVLLSLDELVSK